MLMPGMGMGTMETGQMAQQQQQPMKLSTNDDEGKTMARDNCLKQ